MGADGAGACTAAKAIKEEDGGGVTVFRPRTASYYSPVRAMAALVLWLGAIHLNLLLVLASVFVFPGRAAALVLATQLLFMLVPVSDTSRWGRKIARFVCEHTVSYFPITLHIEDYAAFHANKAYVFGYEPHCAWPLGLLVLADHLGFMPLPKIKILASSAAFWTPFQRQIWTWLGLIPATRENFCSYLRAGYSCAVVPGGLREMLHMVHKHDSEVAFIKSRKGFVRIAVQTGCPLVPVFCFGQGHAYSWWRSRIKLLVKITRAMKVPPVIFWGMFGTPIPFRLHMHVFVGRPIEVKKNDQPTIDEINEVHDQFVVALQELFDKHKNKAGYPNLHLRIM